MYMQLTQAVVMRNCGERKKRQ